MPGSPYGAIGSPYRPSVPLTGSLFYCLFVVLSVTVLHRSAGYLYVRALARPKMALNMPVVLVSKGILSEVFKVVLEKIRKPSQNKLPFSILNAGERAAEKVRLDKGIQTQSFGPDVFGRGGGLPRDWGGGGGGKKFGMSFETRGQKVRHVLRNPGQPNHKKLQRNFPGRPLRWGSRVFC